MITISDIAKKSNVSKAAVSLAMRNKPGIGQETKKRILKVASELGYRPALNRQNGKKKYFGQIGLLFISQKIPAIGEDFFGGSYLHAILNGAMNRAQEASLGLAICTMTIPQLKSGELPALLQRPSVDAWLVRSPYIPELEKLLASLNEPFVLLEPDRNVKNATQVQPENIQAMIDISNHIISTGAKKIATITGHMDHINAQERLAGLQVGLQQHGIHLNEKNIIIGEDFNSETGAAGIETLIKRGVEFDAVVCQNDMIAAGVIDVLLAKGITPGKDVMITGVDNMEFSSRLACPLTTIDTLPYELGKLGTKLLTEEIESNTDSLKKVHMKLPCKLVIRESTTSFTSKP